jgi:hypothetical protein
VSYTFIANTFGMTCLICCRGWDLTGASLADQYRWSLTESYVHRTCLDRHIGLTERAIYHDALCNAQIRFATLEPVPNRYTGEPLRPWYQAHAINTSFAFLLGYRKRVHHVEAVPRVGTKLGWADAAREAFDGENVTKEFSSSSVLLHAWSDEKLREYLVTIARVAGLTARHEPAESVE